MRVLVTGATSDAGLRLVARLRAKGHHVVCCVRDAARAPACEEVIEATLPDQREVTPTPDLVRVENALEGCALVYCLTHIRHVPPIVQRARRAGVIRTVCVSSARRFTRWPDEPAHAVIRAERALSQWADGWVALRATMIYGGERDKNIARLERLVQRWPVIPLPGGGRHLIQPLHVDDLVDALLAAGHASGAHGRVIDVAGPEPIPYRRAIELIAAHHGLRRLLLPVPLAPAVLLARLGGPRLRDRVRRLGEDRVLDIAEARSVLDFHPRPLEEGLARAEPIGD